MYKEFKTKIVAINSKEFVKMAKKKGAILNRKEVALLPNGTFLCLKQNLEKGEITVYILRGIYLKKISMGYSCYSERRSGRELLISSFELQAGPVLEKNRQIKRKRLILI